MLNKIYFALFFVIVGQRNVLGCHHCPNLLKYNYVITAETFPSGFLRDCGLLMGQQSCSIDLHIDLDQQTSTLNVTSSTEYVQTSIKVIDAIENGLQHKRYISFWCSDSHRNCNDEHYLQRVLQSITIEGSFKFKEREPRMLY